MKVAHYTNDFSLHQTNLADELYSLLGNDFRYFEMSEDIDAEKSSYTSIEDRPYLVRVWRDDKDLKQAMNWAEQADVAMFATNDAMVPLIKARLKKGLLTFEGGERWFKRGLINIFSPQLLRNQWRYHTYYYNKPIYKLCSSAYGANDQYFLQSYKDKCYKWGYFTKVGNFEVEAPRGVSTSGSATILWCARFLKLKHPEMVVKLARRLKDSGYTVVVDMYGTGVELDNTQRLCESLGVKELINFKGNVKNEIILKEMRSHDIFLFTSDRHEGWGAVLNEAMSNGCTVVASNAIGSVPFLVTDNENGMIFKSECMDSLYEKTTYLLDHPEERERMAYNAYKTMRDIWSPRKGAENFIQLSEDLLHGRETSVLEGPCSKALPI